MVQWLGSGVQLPPWCTVSDLFLGLYVWFIEIELNLGFIDLGSIPARVFDINHLITLSNTYESTHVLEIAKLSSSRSVNLVRQFVGGNSAWRSVRGGEVVADCWSQQMFRIWVCMAPIKLKEPTWPQCLSLFTVKTMLRCTQYTKFQTCSSKLAPLKDPSSKLAPLNQPLSKLPYPFPSKSFQVSIFFFFKPAPIKFPSPSLLQTYPSIFTPSQPSILPL